MKLTSFATGERGGAGEWGAFSSWVRKGKKKNIACPWPDIAFGKGAESAISLYRC